jgi:hypothetical protein
MSHGVFSFPISRPRWIGFGLFFVLAAVAVFRVSGGLGVLAGSGCFLIGLSFLFANVLALRTRPFAQWERASFLSVASLAFGFILVVLAARGD